MVAARRDSCSASKYHSQADGVCDARDAADREHRRPGLDRHRAPAHGRVADEDDRALRRVDLVAVERERGMADDHDVRLLVPERLLGVLLDDVVARGQRAVGVDPEGVDAERPAQRLPVHAGDGDRLDLGDAQHGVRLRPSPKRYQRAPAALPRPEETAPSNKGLHPPTGCLQVWRGRGVTLLRSPGRAGGQRGVSIARAQASRSRALELPSPSPIELSGIGTGRRVARSISTAVCVPVTISSSSGSLTAATS